ncbi:hypothetical protein BN946_scf184983.g27 [Trametes cinnabarina]|uniref:Uncharacterized protein n=1 Tax=Pycnoporus cinnabarinus TaxID=5643 RepID=A0A060SJY5_PYCCI|nr:hypothetical protein BN946_scf184983.g27 [Trametes cinnabarina]
MSSTIHPDALLHALNLAKNPRSFHSSEQDRAVSGLLDLSIICAKLATQYASNSSPPIDVIINNDHRKISEAYSKVLAALHDYADPYSATSVTPTWQEPASSAESGRPQVTLSSEAMTDLISSLVPQLHSPVHDSVVSAASKSLIGPLSKTFYPRVVAQIRAQLLEELKTPLLDYLTPVLERRVVDYVLGDDLKDDCRSTTDKRRGRPTSAHASTSSVPVSMNFDAATPSISGPPTKRARRIAPQDLSDPQILPEGHPPVDPFLAMPSMFSVKGINKSVTRTPMKHCDKI